MDTAEYIWGGEGNDEIYGGAMIGATGSFINGNQGHDVIHPGSYGNAAGSSNINAGKGDDIVNPFSWDYTAGALTGVSPASKRPIASTGGQMNYGVNWKGGPGDDTMWHAYQLNGSATMGEYGKLYGNSGNDKLYGAWTPGAA